MKKLLFIISIVVSLYVGAYVGTNKLNQGGKYLVDNILSSCQWILAESTEITK